MCTTSYPSVEVALLAELGQKLLPGAGELHAHPLHSVAQLGRHGLHDRDRPVLVQVHLLHPAPGLVVVLLLDFRCADAHEAAKDAHAVCILTEWDESKALDWGKDLRVDGEARVRVRRPQHPGPRQAQVRTTTGRVLWQALSLSRMQASSWKEKPLCRRTPRWRCFLQQKGGEGCPLVLCRTTTTGKGCTPAGARTWHRRLAQESRGRSMLLSPRRASTLLQVAQAFTSLRMERMERIVQ